MKKVLLNTYDGFPKENSGGPNRIIYQLIKYNQKKELSFDFSTYKYFIDNIRINSNSDMKIPPRKQLTNYLFENIKLYKKYTTSAKYLKKYYQERDNYFENFAANYKCDVIHSHSTLAHYHFRNSSAKKVLTIHSKGSLKNDMADEIESNEFLQKQSLEFARREVIAYNSSDIVTFPGNFAKELFINDYKGELDENIPVEIIHNGVDLDYVNQIVSDENILEKIGISTQYDYYLLNVANHVKHKNVDKVIETVSEIKSVCNINPLLINVGTGPLSGYLVSVAKHFNLSSNVYFIPRLPYRDVLLLMKKCDALIMLSERIIFDLTILDAVASSCVVISNLEGGNMEILDDYEKFINIENFNFSTDLKSKIKPMRTLKSNKDLSVYKIEKTICDYSILYE